MAEAVARDPEVAGDLVLAIVGGPSGADHGAEVARLLELAARARRERARDAVPAAAAIQARRLLHGRRRRARAVALGVVRPGGARGAGLRHAGRRRGGRRAAATWSRTAGRGFLVEGHDPGDHADRLLQILRDPALAVVARRGGRPTGPPIHLGRHDRASCCRSTTRCWHGRLTCGVIVRCDMRHIAFELVTFSLEPLTCAFMRLTCGNVGVDRSSDLPLSFASLQAVEANDAKEPDDAKGTPQGDPERGPGKVARPERDPGREGRKTGTTARNRRSPPGEPGRELVRRRSAARRASEGQAVGAPRGEPPLGPSGRPRDGRGGCLEHQSPRG